MSHALVGILMGSDSDWPKIKGAAAALTEFNIPYEVRVMSAHRTPDLVQDYAATADRAGPAGDHRGGGRRGPPGRRRRGAYRAAGDWHPRAHRVAGRSRFPAFDGADARRRARGHRGRRQWRPRNAGLLAVQMLSLADPALQEKYTAYKRGLVEKVLAKDAALQATIGKT